uniref:Uncharacterized protein n=1 Tax=Molossus molossus TaxID=27622 RepID=A0A7J8E3J6_MOLMO|nr:hypothetical protein HJG59_009052 [Molossus molossus]
MLSVWGGKPAWESVFLAVRHTYSPSLLKRHTPGSLGLWVPFVVFPPSPLSVCLHRPGKVMCTLDQNGDLNIVETPKARQHKCLYIFFTESIEPIDCSICLRYGKFPLASTICSSCKSHGGFFFFISHCIKSTKHPSPTALD